MWRSDFLNIKITEKHLLIAILFLAAILRFWGLGSAEIFHDEGLYAFRSIGYFDFIQNDDQSTPVQWFKDVALPWWASLSFHDAPPVFFIIQKIFFDFFGDSLFAARLPSALAGLASVYLIYLISISIFRRLDSHIFGLLAALLLAVNHIHIWISRSSLMESLLIFLILLNIYFFFRFLDDRRRWPWFGATLGLCFLTKYLSFFLVPVYVFYLIFISIFRTSEVPKIEKNIRTSDVHILKSWRLYAALGLALLLFTPVIIYNIFLYKTTGHFDLQFAYLLGQDTPEWRVSFGKTQDPFSDIPANLVSMYSIPFLLLVLAGICYAIYGIFKSKIQFLRTSDNQIFWLLNFVFITLLLVAVGSAFRFISLYALTAVILITHLFYFLLKKYGKSALLKILIAAFLIYEIFFTIDGIFLTFPDFGVQKLDQYLNAVIGNQRSALRPSHPNPHLDKIIQTYADKYPSSGKRWMIVYDENVALSTRLWVFVRRLYYHGIPVNTTRQFLGLIRSEGIGAFQGYEIYFIRATDYTSLNEHLSVPDAADFENFLKSEQGLSPAKVIYGYDDFPMFYAYKILL